MLMPQIATRSYLANRLMNCIRPTLPFLLTLFALTPAAFVPAQAVNAPAAVSIGQASVDEQHRLQSDRSVVNRIQSLQRNIQQRNESGIREDLRLLATADPHSMVPSGDRIYVPVFRRQMELIHSADTRLLQQLRQEHKVESGAMLASAATALETDTLLKLIQRFPFSEAACAAHQLLARVHLERGHTLAAIWWLRPLAHRNVPVSFRDRTRAMLDTLTSSVQSNAAAAGATTADRGGNASSEVNPMLPDSVAWQHHVSTSPELKAGMQKLVQGAAAAGAVPWTVWQPVIDRDQVFARTLRGIDAIDAESGESRWNYRLPGTLMEGLEVPVRLLDSGSADPQVVFRQIDNSSITDRMMRDAVTGRITADRYRLYVVNTNDATTDAQSLPGRAVPRSRGKEAVNELIAIAASSGRPVWIVGGKPIEASFGNELSGSWICGAPAVSASQLFCVVEQNESIFLVCLDATTGNLQWKRFLVFPESAVSSDKVRKLFSATPTLKDGIAWTQTTTGWTTSVDVMTQVQIWATRPSTPERDTSSSPFGSRTTPRTPTRSLTQSWRQKRIQLAGDALVICPHLSHRLIVLDALTGNIRMQRPASRHVLLLHVGQSDQSVVVGGAGGIESWSLQTGKTKWHTRLPDGQIPAGTGAVRDGQLVLPVNDGRLAAIHLETGAIVDASKNPVMSIACGGVLAVESDLLLFGPLGITRVTADQRDDGIPTMESVLQLVADDEFQGALQAISQIPVTVLNRSELHSLRFQCLSESLVPGADEAVQKLDELQRLSATAANEAVIRKLQIEHQIARGDVDVAVDLLLESFQMPAATLSAGISRSVRQLLSTTSAEPQPRQNVDARLEIVFRTWLSAQLREFLSTDDQMRVRIVEATAKWTDQQILSIVHPALVDELIARGESHIAAGRLDETTVQLLLSAAAASVLNSKDEAATTAADDRVLQLLRRAAEAARPDAEQSPSQLSRIPAGLIEVLLTDLQQASPISSVDGLASNSDAELRKTENTKRITDMWSTWSTLSFRMVPVSQSTSFRRADTMLAVARSSDQFLSRYRWSLHHSPAMLMVRNSTDAGKTPWIIPGAYSEQRQALFGGEHVLRSGSVVLVIASHRLTAVSVIDQRILWSRTFVAGSPNGPLYRRSSTRSFRDFGVQLRRRGVYSDRAFRICGLDARTVCVQSSDGVEVLDLYSGILNWKLSGDLPRVPVFATSSAVLAGVLLGDSGLAIDLIDATLIRRPIGMHDLLNTIVANESNLAVWRSGEDPGTAGTVVWIDEKTGESIRSAGFNNAKSFQFVDQSTLAAISPDQTFLILNLKTGVQRTYEFRNDDAEADVVADADQPAGTFDANEPSPGPPGAQRPRDFDLWSAERVLIFQDALNYYVVNRRDAASPPTGLSLTNHLTEVQGELRAINRDSGKLSWVARVPDVASVTFDQPLLPMLMFVEIQPSAIRLARQARPLQQLSFRAVAKSTGRLMFEHRTIARYPVPLLEIDTQTDGTVDVEAFGSRVRFIPE
jgi:outer membrane protein assembly factor BamB